MAWRGKTLPLLLEGVNDALIAFIHQDQYASYTYLPALKPKKLYFKTYLVHSL